MSYAARMLHTPFPLPALWTTRIDWFFMAIFPPVVDPAVEPVAEPTVEPGAEPGATGHVVARCGGRLVSCGRDDGAIAWTAEVDPEAGNGAFLVFHDGSYLTEVARLPPSCLGTIVAVDRSGRQQWRTDLDTMVALGSAAVCDGELCALSLPQPSDRPALLYRLALANGALHAAEPLPWPADGLLAVPGGLLVRNQRTADSAPGLYLLDADHRRTAVLPDAVVEFAHAGDLRLVITRAGASHTARLYTAGMELLWHAPIAGPAAALAGSDVLHVEDADSGKASVLVCRDARTGEVRWRSALLPPQIPSISVAGGIVMCNHRKGQVVCRQRDGYVLGHVRGSYGPPAQHGDRLYLCRPGAMLCVSLAALDEPGAPA